jgi:hypothetical protein
MHLIFQPSSLDERTTEELKYWEAMVCRYCPWLVDQKENANVTAAFVLFIPLFYLHTHTGVFAEGHMHLHRHPVTPRHAMDNDLITPRETSFVCIAQAPLIYTRTLIRQRVRASSARYTLSVFVGRDFSFLVQSLKTRITHLYIFASDTHFL